MLLQATRLVTLCGFTWLVTVLISGQLAVPTSKHMIPGAHSICWQRDRCMAAVPATLPVMRSCTGRVTCSQAHHQQLTW